jgi:FADH2 O2-dependent halogenase
MNADFDIAIVGSGFGGSLLAMIARRLGRSVVLLERGRHPRFAIGESSTPLASLLLEELALRYELPGIAALAKWGSWQKAHPQIGCGLKRGFTFYHHRSGQAWKDTPDRGNQLLVAASPHDGVADTHWYRPDFDQFLAQQAQQLGVELIEEARLDRAEFSESGADLSGTLDGSPLRVRARFVVDASGPRGFLHRVLALAERPMTPMPATQGLYTHFEGVRRWDELHSSADPPPYPVDDAAMHHVFEGGWIWVLRFNNGVTSAGVAAGGKPAGELRFEEGAAAWKRLLHRLPSVGEQFEGAVPRLPFIHAPRLPFRSATVAGDRWALLPSAAGFVDPLLSTGFPLTLLGIERLARTWETGWEAPRLAIELRHYERQTLGELDATAGLVGALYANLGDFETFTALTHLYFAAAMYSETVRRLGQPGRATSFLLHDHPQFGPALGACIEQARRTDRGPGKAHLRDAIAEAIEPINLAGLGEAGRRNWYPCRADDLLIAAPKLGANRRDIERLLDRCGFAMAKK